MTAQKRAQSLRDVPITINAASGTQLASAGVTEINNLAKIAPSFAVGTSFDGTQVFSLRGINFNTTQISAPPAVSTYTDEAILPYSVMTGWLLLDVERVEVLKGPQGTLFGQNATGGSVNVVAAKPTANFTAGLRTEVNNFGQVFGEGYVSGPLSSTLRARLAASTTQFGRWQKGYYLTTRRNGKADEGSARLLLDWTPTDRLKLSVNVNANYDRSEQQQYQVARVSLVNAANVPFPGLTAYPPGRSNRDADFSDNLDTRRKDRQYQGVLRADYELGDAATLTSLTSYADFKMRHSLDGDGTVFDSLVYKPNGKIKTVSQEVHLTGKAADGRLTYILGGNYERDKILDANDIDEPLTSFTAALFLRTPLTSTAKSAGVFGNIDFEVIPGLTVTGGVRYTATKATQRGCTIGFGASPFVYSFIANTVRANAGLPPTDIYANAGPSDCLTINNLPSTAGGTSQYLPASLDQSKKAHNTAWRAGLNYKPNRDTLIYGLVSRGYKAGVFPGAVAVFFVTDLPYVKQEKITSYEIGTKVSLLDRALSANLSAFYYDYKDKQFQTYVEIPVLFYNQTITNIPKSSVKGIDLDFTAVPVEGLTIRGAATYIKTRVGNFIAKLPIILPSGDLQTANVKGSEFSFAPPLSASLDAEYRYPLSGELSGYVGASMQYTARSFNDLGEDPTLRIPAYTLYDARIGVASDKGWTAGLFVRNLTDKHYWTSQFRTADIFARFTGMPRTFGGTASFKF